jgi:hypothetical protein
VAKILNFGHTLDMLRADGEGASVAFVLIGRAASRIFGPMVTDHHPIVLFIVRPIVALLCAAVAAGKVRRLLAGHRGGQGTNDAHALTAGKHEAP